jgi:AbiU2
MNGLRREELGGAIRGKASDLRRNLPGERTTIDLPRSRSIHRIVEGRDMGDDIAKRDVQVFTDHCVFLWSIFRHTEVLYWDADEEDHIRMREIARTFFGDLSVVLKHFLLLEVCKITDEASPDREAREAKEIKNGLRYNHTIDFLLKHCTPSQAQRLAPLRNSINTFRDKILTARNKLIAHSDREANLSDQPLTNVRPADWKRLWANLDQLVDILNKEIIGTSRHITDITMQGTDADSLLTVLHREKILRDQATLRARGDHSPLR